MTTQQCIERIKALFKENGENTAVLRPIEKYNEVDWEEVAKVFGTDKINAYTQGDKIVIEA